MFTEHWYSPTQRCWFIADTETGDLITDERDPKYALSFDSEEALLKRFPLSSHTELMG